MAGDVADALREQAGKVEDMAISVRERAAVLRIFEYGELADQPEEKAEAIEDLKSD